MEAKPTLLVSGQVAFAHVEHVSLVISTVARWTPESIEEFIVSSYKVTGKATGPRANVSHFLGDSPGPIIRKQMVTVMERLGVVAAPRTVVLTDSNVLRNMMIAWTWLTNADARTFSPTARRDALSWTVDGDKRLVDVLDTTLIQCYQLARVQVPVVRAAS